jgi:hypothetical protein
MATCVQPLTASHSDKRRSRLESTHFRRHLAIGYKAQARHHRPFVNIKTTAASMQQHFVSGRWHDPKTGLFGAALRMLGSPSPQAA